MLKEIKSPGFRGQGKDFLFSGFNPNIPLGDSTYFPAGYKFFPERLTGTVGMDFIQEPFGPEKMKQLFAGAKIKS